MGNAVTQRDEPPGHSGCWPCETVIDSQLQSSDVEIVKIAVERSEAIPFLKMAVLMLPEPLPKEVADVPENDQNQVADVGRDQVIVRRIFDDGLGEEAAGMAAGIPVTLVAQWTELSLLSCYPTSLSWRRWLEESGGWFVFVCSICLCRGEKDGGERQRRGADVRWRSELR